jgi:ankyrin repeat protein
METDEVLLGSVVDGSPNGGGSVDVNTKDSLGRSSLHIAASAEDSAMVTLLHRFPQINTDLKE